MTLATENPDYSMTKKELIEAGMTEERIWKCSFSPSSIRLVPEPDNPHDPNAIKVLVDGIHVGYIKQGSCAHIRNIYKNKSIVQVSCEISGGPYKFVSEDYDYEKEKDVYTLEKDTAPFFVHLKITEKV